MVSLICKLFGHKYEPKPIDDAETVVLYLCKRCGKNRDVFKPGEKHDIKIMYYKRGDGKKDVEQ